MRDYNKEEQAMIEAYKGSVTQCNTHYAKDNKQATSKQGYGVSMTTAYTPIQVEGNEDVSCKDYDINIEYRSYGYEYAIKLADIALYRLLMKQDEKYQCTLKRFKKHIKRKARASANKDNISKNGTTKRKAYKKRERVVLPSSLNK